MYCLWNHIYENGRLKMAWIYLLFAGLSEIGWPVGLKLAQTSTFLWLGIFIAAFFIAISTYFLYLAQKSIPLGTAYAVWTGIGAVGTFIVGILFFADHLHPLRLFGAFLIVSGILFMKIGDKNK